MADLLYLVHRMPYPPDKGDKLRSYHLLQHLKARHRVFLGTFVDDPADMVHLPALRELCADVHVQPLQPARAKLASLAGLLTGRAQTLHYYASTALGRWVAQTLQRERIAAAVVFSSSMAPYAMAHPTLPMLLDMVDVDSAKWTDYAPHHRWPLSWLYRREGRELLRFERAAVAASRRSFLATDKEVHLLEGLAPDCAGRVEAMGNGVDTDYFHAEASRASPFEPDEVPLVFTGAMDYWPNIDAVTWFAREVLPALRQRRPRLRLHVVGRSPAPAVKALADRPGTGVVVTGTVPDVRPWLQHAAVVVAPLRLARGVQNKVLEAMAMARPVVAATACAEALGAEDGRELLAAADPADYQRCIEALLTTPDRAAAIGNAGRQRVERLHTWPAQLAVIDRHLPSPGAPPAAARSAMGSSEHPQPLARSAVPLSPSTP
jgi:sugar transferase (PEP-CTERM/EpsH1 system associated)